MRDIRNYPDYPTTEKYTQKPSKNPPETLQKPSSLSEAAEQALVVEWLRRRQGVLFAAVPNGGKRNAREAASLRRQGVRPGVPDLLIFEARSGAHGLAIEMKREKGGTVSRPQRRWHDDLRERGWRVEVCRGHREAIAILTEYLS